MSGVFAAPDGDDDTARRARALRDAVEPVAAAVYFAPEVHAAFAALGFGPGTTEPGHLTLPDLAAYFCSRAGCLGTVPGPVVTSVFGVFAPELVEPEVARGWATASRADILAAREDGTTAALQRILSDPPGRERATALLRRAARAGRATGRPLFAGLGALPPPATGWGRLWRAADLVREHRGDAHLAAWTAAGLDPVEAGLLTEAYHGMPARRYHATRGWSAAALDAGEARLRARDLLDGDPPGLTTRGRELREGIEVATDRQQAPLLDALGDDLDELLAILRPWSAAIVAADGFPRSVEQIPASWGRRGEN